MPRKVGTITKNDLIATPLPEATETYTVIPHEMIMNHALTALQDKGFIVVNEIYKSNFNGDIAQGIYKLSYGSDPEMAMMFAWSNSYDKSMRFKCAIGGFLHGSNNAVISGEMNTWSRKHTGTAVEEVLSTIQDQINIADDYYNQLVKDKNNMKLVSVTLRKAAEILGVLYLDKCLLTNDQLNIVKQELKKMPNNTLWSFYNAIIYSLQKSHPKFWMDQQRSIHWFICDEFQINNLPIEVGDKNQLVLIELVGEVSYTEHTNEVPETYDNGYFDTEVLVKPKEEIIIVDVAPDLQEVESIKPLPEVPNYEL